MMPGEPPLTHRGGGEMEFSSDELDEMGVDLASDGAPLPPERRRTLPGIRGEGPPSAPHLQSPTVTDLAVETAFEQLLRDRVTSAPTVKLLVEEAMVPTPPPPHPERHEYEDGVEPIDDVPTAPIPMGVPAELSEPQLISEPHFIEEDMATANTPPGGIPILNVAAVGAQLLSAPPPLPASVKSLPPVVPAVSTPPVIPVVVAPLAISTMPASPAPPAPVLSPVISTVQSTSALSAGLSPSMVPGSSVISVASMLSAVGAPPAPAGAPMFSADAVAVASSPQATLPDSHGGGLVASAATSVAAAPTLLSSPSTAQTLPPSVSTPPLPLAPPPVRVETSPPPAPRIEAAPTPSSGVPMLSSVVTKLLGESALESLNSSPPGAGADGLRRARLLDEGPVLSSSPPPDASGPRVTVAPAAAGEVELGKPSLATAPTRPAARGDEGEELPFEEFEEVSGTAPPPLPVAVVSASPPAIPALAANGAGSSAAGGASATVTGVINSSVAPAPPPMPGVEGRRKRRAKQWFEEVFDEDYLRTLPFLTPAQTERDVAFIVDALGIPPASSVLDVACGYGRHAMVLAARNFRVTGLDLSLPLLIRAADAARRSSLNVNFVHGDMREMAFDGEFDAVYCYFTSFGYFDDETNRKVAALVARALRPGGRFLLDVVNRDYIVGDLPARVWWQGDGCMVLEEVSFNYFTSRLQVQRSIVFEDGRQTEQEISIRAYSLHEIGKILHRAGFRVIEVSGGPHLRGRFFGSDSRQTLVVAEKKKDP